MAEFVIEMGAIEELRAACDDFLDDRLGPLIEADAKRYAPKRTGEMAALIYHYVDDQTLYIVSPADYTYWVEMGHDVFHPSTGITGPEEVVAQPFLRPALYKYRSPELLDPPAMFPVAVKKPGNRSYPNLFEYEQQRLHWKFDVPGGES